MFLSMVRHTEHKKQYHVTERTSDSSLMELQYRYYSPLVSGNGEIYWYLNLISLYNI